MIKPAPQVFGIPIYRLLTCLRSAISTQVLVVGGGMAGLVAAYSFAQRGKKVTVIEKNYCGGGASGKSSDS